MTDFITPVMRVGLIIPSANRLTEPQFNRYLPPEIGVYVSRGRTAGPHLKSQAQLEEEIRRAAEILSDCEPDVIVFHCTGTSMKDGAAGETRILQLVQEASGRPAAATSEIVIEAFATLNVRSVVLLSPYRSNNIIVPYLQGKGITVVHEFAAGCSSGPEYEAITPQQWVEIAKQNDRPEADGVFLSCTDTQQIEAVSAIEEALGKPVVNSNQAVIWSCFVSLQKRHQRPIQLPALGRLLQTV